jgi:DNA-binding NarL/FixJ family response regulator
VSDTGPVGARKFGEAMIELADHPSDDGRPRLIVADDDPVVRSILGMTLSESFNIVGVAADGEEAIDLARASQPDAAVVDVEMPGGGGLHAVRGIVVASPGTAIVILSGDESDEGVRQLMSAGAIAYLRKGLATPAFVASVTASIRAHARMQGGPS